MVVFTRALGLSLVLTIGELGAWAQEPAPPSAVTQILRVRAGTPRLKALIDEAIALSPTFRRVVRSIEATDGIVQVGEGRCRFRLKACLSWHVTSAGPYRMVFVTVDAERGALEVMASVAHELQHALEIFENPALRRNSDVALFYLRDKSLPYMRSIDTDEAEAIGRVVMRELEQVSAGLISGPGSWR